MATNAIATVPTVGETLTRRRRRRRVFLVAGAAAILVAAAIGWRYVKTGPAVHYVTAPVTRGDIARTVTASGSVNPQTTVQVGTYVSGSIQAVSCDYNTRVKKNQLCAKIDPRPYQSEVDQDRANVQAAQAQLAKDKSNLALTDANNKRSKALFDQQLLSQDQYDAAKATYDQAVSQVQVDEASVTQRNATLESAEISLGYTNIVSPVDGTVVSRNVTVGQTVAASFQTPTLFLIATDLTKMQIDTSVSEGDIGGVKEGAPASFTVEAFAGRHFDGTVTQVRQAPEAVQNVVTYDVVVTVANPDLLLKPGMTANVRVVVDQRENVLRVPDQALRYTPGGLSAEQATAAPSSPPGGLLGLGRIGRGTGRVGGGARGGQREGRGGSGAQTNTAQVFVLRDGQPVAIPVTTGLDDDTMSEVAQGEIEEGDQVIVSETRGDAKPGAAPQAGRR